MSHESDQERATRKSRAWKARQAQIADAWSAEDRHARLMREALLRQRMDRYHEFTWSAVVIFPLIVVCGALLYHQWGIMNGRVGGCLAAPAARLHEENCAHAIEDSFWWWMLNGEQKDAIRAEEKLDR